MNHRQINQESVRQPSGFTLLELMLAIGLTSLLMAAVYGAMSTYWNLALESHEEIERAQIARSLLQMLARDIQSCTFAEQMTQADDGGADGSDATSGSGNVEAGTSVYRNGLIGTDRDVILYISYPARDLNYVATPDAVNSSERHSDQLIVHWLLAESSGGPLASALCGLFSVDGDGGVAGLARGTGGVSGFGQAIQSGSLDLQVESTILEAEEVQGVVFEYFDGVEWLTEWDSTTLNKMPQAVRVQLTLRKKPAADGSSTPKPTDLPPTTHSLVIPIPIAAPYVEETAL